MARVARSVYLPDTLNTWLVEEAERRGLSVNALIILALEQMREQQKPPQPPKEEPPASSDVLDFD